MRKLLLIALIVINMILIITSVIYLKNLKTPTPKISREQAEMIAILQAEKDGYKEPSIWNRFNSESRLMSWYENKKITQYWKVKIDARGNPPNKNAPAAEYNIDAMEGTIDSVIRGLTQAGMDLQIHVMQLINDSINNKIVYEAKVMNHGEQDYDINWIEPVINQNLKSNFSEETPRVNVNKILKREEELTITCEISYKVDQLEINQDIIIGVLINLGENDETSYFMIDTENK